MTPDSLPPWLTVLDEEDLAFIRRFLLASGSLKELAAAYGISYPTVRLRLDRLIARIRIAEDRRIMGPFERRLRLAHAEGRIDFSTMQELLAAHRAETEDSDET